MPKPKIKKPAKKKNQKADAPGKSRSNSGSRAV